METAGRRINYSTMTHSTRSCAFRWNALNLFNIHEMVHSVCVCVCIYLCLRFVFVSVLCVCVCVCEVYNRAFFTNVHLQWIYTQQHLVIILRDWINTTTTPRQSWSWFPFDCSFLVFVFLCVYTWLYPWTYLNCMAVDRGAGGVMLVWVCSSGLVCSVIEGGAGLAVSK